MAANAALLNGSLTSINLGNWCQHIPDQVLAQHSVGPPVGKSTEYPMISLICHATCLLHPGVLSMICLHWMWVSHKYYSEVGSSQVCCGHSTVFRMFATLHGYPGNFKTLW
ncbi:hypothetical protein B0H10DRAFT_1940429 [Mycena sp. CBHHK59/15]|nr:hypothetical protein B0H10DRAFT_1940429 [Mycena sp. CBHHK59/15]